MTLFVDRMIRAAKLDGHVYEEVETDNSAMSHWDYSSEWLRTGSEPLMCLLFLKRSGEQKFHG